MNSSGNLLGGNSKLF